MFILKVIFFYKHSIMNGKHCNWKHHPCLHEKMSFLCDSKCLSSRTKRAEKCNLYKVFFEHTCLFHFSEIGITHQSYYWFLASRIIRSILKKVIWGDINIIRIHSQSEIANQDNVKSDFSLFVIKDLSAKIKIYHIAV